MNADDFIKEISPKGTYVMIVTDQKELHDISLPIPAEEQDAIFGLLSAEIRKHPNALGLAAPQIGIKKRAFVYWGSDGTGKKVLNMVANPEVISMNEPIIDSNEGCLSVPTVFCLVKRYSQVEVKDDVGGRFVLDGDDALVFQHESDHLDGLLITDIGVRIPKDIGRNDRCYCGSGKKYKKCHGQ